MSDKQTHFPNSVIRSRSNNNKKKHLVLFSQCSKLFKRNKNIYQKKNMKKKIYGCKSIETKDNT